MAARVLERRLFETCLAEKARCHTGLDGQVGHSCIRGNFSVVAIMVLATTLSVVWLSLVRAGSDPDRELLESESTTGTHMSHRLSAMVPESRFPEMIYKSTNYCSQASTRAGSHSEQKRSWKAQDGARYGV